jgi:hypothetical protein
MVDEKKEKKEGKKEKKEGRGESWQGSDGELRRDDRVQA